MVDRADGETLSVNYTNLNLNTINILFLIHLKQNTFFKEFIFLRRTTSTEAISGRIDFPRKNPDEAQRDVHKQLLSRILFWFTRSAQ